MLVNQHSVFGFCGRDCDWWKVFYSREERRLVLTHQWWMFTHVTYLGRHITSMLEGTGKKDSLLLISRIGGGIWTRKELVAFTEQKGPVFKKDPTGDQHSHLHGPEQSHLITCLPLLCHFSGWDACEIHLKFLTVRFITFTYVTWNQYRPYQKKKKIESLVYKAGGFYGQTQNKRKPVYYNCFKQGL